MNLLNGCSLNKFPLHLQYVADLIYFDGPLLSLFENQSGESYLYCWSDVNAVYNRWLVFRVTKNSLQNYLQGQVSLRDLILNPVDGFHYAIDIDNDLEVKNTFWVLPENLPDSYVPEEDSYHDPSLLNPERGEEDIKLIKNLIIPKKGNQVVVLTSEKL
ncbi:hypothetical protein PCC9214_02779 [Planktothrix tepida]|uniref:DUF6575 domain-containing protein n=2 Tax=Planktothrix TaxID=54304 RepID=A0A1J1LPS1_9CYAN|nr:MULTISPECIES: DUF6575 domain-containing protein [Planktothrix]CAD5954631.1 hypothetical protein PCC9214_02779 [Planktothrix tepida]CAD5955974.1 hypothetical protein NO713_02882 [Planktothrix pseudagardhii]CUR34222.1 conserved hypothetical protein [Planktothrix tepida PCC 9214]